MARNKLQLAAPLGHSIADKRLEILRGVGECGSISQAARQAGVSYKAAWQALDTLSNLAGAALVQRQVGGAGGGGARLTPAGVQLLEAAAEMERARQEAWGRLAGSAPGLGALSLRTSMRNQLPCKVQQLTLVGPLAEVAVVLPGGARLVSRLTAESAQLLGLAPGLPALALCKATAVRVARAAARQGPAVPNQLLARATRVSCGSAGDEVSAQLEGGGPQVVGFAQPGSGLRAGHRVCLAVDDAAVVLALAA